MTPLQQEPSAPAPWMRTMFGRVLISGFLSWACLVAILRRKAAAGVSAALLHFADACCAASVAVPPVWPAGKGPRDFGLDPRRAARGRPSARRDHPAAAGDPCTGRPDPGCCWPGRPRADGVWAACDTNAGLVS